MKPEKMSDEAWKKTHIRVASLRKKYIKELKTLLNSRTKAS
ncbi:hypothetical protein [Paenibacillus sp. FSL P2-0173]